MIDSCMDCKSNCCRVGPGPYEVIPVEQYLYNFERSNNYNKKCEHLDNGLCRVWGTDKFPIDCAIYVCHVREFSPGELNAIKLMEDKLQGSYTIWTSQGQGSVEIAEFWTLKTALEYVKEHENEASFAIEFPNGEWYKWRKDDES